MEKVPLYRVHQWLDSWLPVEQVKEWGPVPHHFYLTSLSLMKLRKLAGVHVRDKITRKEHSKGAGYQRALEQSRTRKISRFIESGFPLSSDTSLAPEKYPNLVHPGWLPTAILVNVLSDSDERERGGKKLRVAQERLLHIEHTDNQDFLIIPEEQFDLTEVGDTTNELQPIEIIDGQHRVFSVDNFEKFPEDYQVPVVIFDGLSESWQAYLFWVINVEPKRINTSLAFDLYPELRTQSWLEHGENIKIYQEHRAQELTELMWRHSDSVWKDRIELFGTRVSGHVSNASFIRSLTSTFIRKWTNPDKLGGLFGSIDENNRILPWKRAQQAAFLIFCWKMLSEQLDRVEANWLGAFSKEQDEYGRPDALTNGKSLLATDQGVRTVHYLFNTFCIKNYEELGLQDWYMSNVPDAPEDESISEALQELYKNNKLQSYLVALIEPLLKYLDWRTSNASGLSGEDKQIQSAYRGSAGYSLLKKNALRALLKAQDRKIVSIANDLLNGK